MSRFLARVTPVAGDVVLVELLSRPTDPGYGGGIGLPDRPDQGLPGGWPDRPDQGLPGHGHPGNSLPVPPVRPDHPIVLPPGMWPPSLPPGTNLPDNSLPPGRPGHAAPPIHIPPDPSIGIEHPIVLPELPPGTALLIALTGANVPQPKDVPPNAKPAILYASGQKPVLVYVTATAAPK